MKKRKPYWKNLICVLSMLFIVLSMAEVKADTNLTKVIQGSLGNNHSAAIKADGSLWMWGWNYYGQLGTGTTVDSDVPIKIMDDVAQVSLNGYQSAMIKSDGSLWMWGNSTTVDSDVPIKIMDDVVQVSLGSSHNAAIKKDGSLWMWGANDYGQLGNGITVDSDVPVKIMDDVAQVSLGGFHSAAIKSDGSLWVWGHNYYGQLGNGTTVNSYVPIKIMDDVVQVSLGGSHSAVIRTNGSLWCWGANDTSQLGTGDTTSSMIPIKILTDVKFVDLSSEYSAAIKEDGSLWTWGRTIGYYDISAIPVKSLENVIEVGVGYRHIAALKADGSLWMWGENSHGQLGVSGTNSSLLPVLTIGPTYTITYDANGGSGAPAMQTKKCGRDLILRTGIPERAGYTFLGWSESPMATTAEYQPEDIYTKENDTVFYAVWETGTYTVLYDANGGTDAPESQSQKCGAALILREGRPTREGYTFLGWSESAEAADAAYYPAGNYKAETDVTLYAVWKLNTYMITYDANGGNNAPMQQTKNHGTNLKLSSSKPERTGYTFLGWSENKTAVTAEYQPSANYTAEKNVTLYAVWKINQYTISYHVNGGTGIVESQSRDYGTDLQLSSTVPVRTDYIFLGWSESATAKTAEYLPAESYKVEKNVTFYAVWQADKCSVSYQANGGSNAPDSQTKVYGTSLVLSSKIPTRTGYTFLGWSESATAVNATYPAGGNYTTEKETTLYAVWKINTYNITYNTNGGSETPAKQTKTYGVDLKLSEVGPIRPGHTFLGWSESNTAASADYQAGETYIAEKDTTLYAVWKPNTYQVTYQLNGGTGDFGTQTKYYGEELKLNSEKPVKDGYVFLGWTTETNDTSVNYQPGETYALEDDMVLYAVWEKEKIIAQKQTISVKTSITKEYKKNSKFKLNATAKTKLTYTSTNKKVVTVSKKGVVTIKGYGNAKIKITAAASEYYKKAGKTVTISVVPAKMTGLKVTSSEKGILLISWKKNKQMDGYEIHFSTSKKFAANKTTRGTLSANSTYARAKNLKSGKTYYVRIRGYRKVKGIQIYGLWSDVKKIKIK